MQKIQQQQQQQQQQFRPIQTRNRTITVVSPKYRRRPLNIRRPAILKIEGFVNSKIPNKKLKVELVSNIKKGGSTAATATVAVAAAAAPPPPPPQLLPPTTTTITTIVSSPPSKVTAIVAATAAAAAVGAAPHQTTTVEPEVSSALKSSPSSRKVNALGGVLEVLVEPSATKNNVGIIKLPKLSSNSNFSLLFLNALSHMRISSIKSWDILTDAVKLDKFADVYNENDSCIDTLIKMGIVNNYHESESNFSCRQAIKYIKKFCERFANEPFNKYSRVLNYCIQLVKTLETSEFDILDNNVDAFIDLSMFCYGIKDTEIKFQLERNRLSQVAIRKIADDKFVLSTRDIEERTEKILNSVLELYDEKVNLNTSSFAAAAGGGYNKKNSMFYDSLNLLLESVIHFLKVDPANNLLNNDVSTLDRLMSCDEISQYSFDVCVFDKLLHCADVKNNVKDDDNSSINIYNLNKSILKDFLHSQLCLNEI